VPSLGFCAATFNIKSAGKLLLLKAFASFKPSVIEKSEIEFLSESVIPANLKPDTLSNLNLIFAKLSIVEAICLIVWQLYANIIEKEIIPANKKLLLNLIIPQYKLISYAKDEYNIFYDIYQEKILFY